MEVKASRKWSSRWQVWNLVGDRKARDSESFSWQLLVAGVHLVLVVRVHRHCHEHVLLHRVGQHPIVKSLVPSDQREKLPIVDPRSIELVGEWTQLDKSNRKVLPGIRPRRPHRSPLNEHFVE